MGSCPFIFWMVGYKMCHLPKKKCEYGNEMLEAVCLFAGSKVVYKKLQG